MSEEFRDTLIARAQQAVYDAKLVQNEAGAQAALVVPFFGILGYEMHNPTEVIPEASVSLGGKFKGRVDYAICQDGEPVIAVECKKVGTLEESNISELYGYYNAFPEVKLGILTDGLIYKLFSDVNRENIMDDEPFAVVDFSEIAEERIPEDAFDALLKLRKGEFDPDDVGADAQRKLYTAAYLEALEANFKKPDKELTKVLMDQAGVKGVKGAKLVDEHADLLSESMSMFLDRKFLERVGLVDRDLVPVPEQGSKEESTDKRGDYSSVHEERVEIKHSNVVTTETEIQIFHYVKHRLPFLIARDEELFKKLDDIQMKDRKQVFNVFYKQENKGRLFGLRERKNSPRYRFTFGDKEVMDTDKLSDIDDKLLALFLARVEELG